MIARGALISTAIIVFLLPSFILTCDKNNYPYQYGIFEKERSRCLKKAIFITMLITVLRLYRFQPRAFAAMKRYMSTLTLQGNPRKWK